MTAGLADWMEVAPVCQFNCARTEATRVVVVTREADGAVIVKVVSGLMFVTRHFSLHQ